VPVNPESDSDWPDLSATELNGVRPRYCTKLLYNCSIDVKAETHSSSLGSSTAGLFS
jgi:hypothetical protein